MIMKNHYKAFIYTALGAIIRFYGALLFNAESENEFVGYCNWIANILIVLGLVYVVVMIIQDTLELIKAFKGEK